LQDHIDRGVIDRQGQQIALAQVDHEAVQLRPLTGDLKQSRSAIDTDNVSTARCGQEGGVARPAP
jgi:hypothetical protein